MASLDLSMAFDLVNTELLVKRLKIMGMPNDLINLIREWLSNRSYYVQLGEDCSVLFDSNTGTIQGSVLGPILYALFVSPLFDLDDLKQIIKRHLSDAAELIKWLDLLHCKRLDPDFNKLPYSQGDNRNRTCVLN